MKTYLCHDADYEDQVVSAINIGASDTPHRVLLPSRDRAVCDVLFVKEQHLTQDDLSCYQFTQLVEVDQNFSDHTVDQLVRTTVDPLLRFNVSSFCAYHHRLAKLFLYQLGQQRESLQLQANKNYDLPLHEAITNATIHGNLELESSFTDLESMGAFYDSVSQRLSDAQYAGRRVVIEASLENGQILLSVTDEGRGHGLKAISNGQHGQPHGRGFSLISENSESLEFEDQGRTSKIAFKI